MNSNIKLGRISGIEIGLHYSWFIIAARTDCRKPASFAVARNCGIVSSSLNAEVNAFDRLHMVRDSNSSCCGLK